MASEIRVDKITSLSGVGTITPSPTGIDIAGITTVATLKATTGIVTTLTATTGIVTTLTANTVTSLGAVSGTTGTFTGDVAISGANITLQDSGGATDDRLTFGAGTDLSIYHDGSHSRIDETGTGNLMIQSDNAVFIKKGTSENIAVFNADGAVELYYDNDKKAETVSTGFSVGNQLSIGEAVINLEKSGTHHHRIIGNDTGGDLGFQQSADNGSNTNFTTYLRINDGGNISLPVDNQILALGASADLQIKHDGSDSFVTNAVGNLNIVNSTNGWIRLQPKSGEEGVIAKYDGAVELYYNNSKSLETTNDGGVKGQGNYIVATSGRGLQFNAGDSGSSEILDDYEEGTFTPSNANVTLTSTEGHYTKIGDLVTVQMIFVVPSTSNTSDIEIDGLPFNAKNGNSGSYIQGGCVTYHNQGGGPYTVLLANNMNRIIVYVANGNRQTLNNFSGRNLRLMATYKVA